MNIFEWWKNRKSTKIMKNVTEIEKLTNLRVKVLKKCVIARKSNEPEQVSIYKKIAQDYELQISKLQEAN